MNYRTKRVIGILLIILSVLVAYALFCYFIGGGIPCVFNKITGLKCPGCGITRMFISLMHFDFNSAFQYNPVVLILSPVIFIIILRAIFVYIKNGDLQLGKKFDILTYVVIAILIIFGILRNII